VQRVNNLEFVKIHVNSDLKVNMTTKKCTNAWTFTVTSKVVMFCVCVEEVKVAHASGATGTGARQKVFLLTSFYAVQKYQSCQEDV
jgi:hypothetical protein